MLFLAFQPDQGIHWPRLESGRTLTLHIVNGKRPGQVQALSAEQEEKPADQQRKTACDRGKARTVKEFKPVQSVDASELLSADLPPIIFLVDGMVSQGLGGLSAKSKLVKVG